MSQKNRDRKGRWRNKTIAFRVSPEENEVLNRKVALSGKTKQDYIINTLLDKEITVLPSPYVIVGIRKELRRFIELYGNDISSDDEEIMKLVLQIVNAMAEEKKTKIKTKIENSRQ